MPRPLGPHRPGVPAYETLRGAADRLTAEIGDAIDRRALDVMIDDALAPEVMTGERVDTLMLSTHVFGMTEDQLVSPPASTGPPGLLAFTERRMIAAHAEGIIRLRRSVEVFALDGTTDFRAVTPTVWGRPLRMYEIANRQGWHRVFLPDPGDVDADVVGGWDRRVAARLVGALTPRWDDTTLDGWNRGNPTVPTRRPPEALDVDTDPIDVDTDHTDDLADDSIDPSGPLPSVDLSGDSRWWET